MRRRPSLVSTLLTGCALHGLAVAQEPPLPQTVEARVLAGNSARVVIPLAGIDPDGDSVGLVGVGAKPAPQFGRIVTPVGTDSIIYEAFSTGPDGKTTEVPFIIQLTDQGYNVIGDNETGMALETITAVPALASRWKRSHNSSRSTGSRPTVGSSRMSRSGEPKSATARLTRER